MLTTFIHHNPLFTDLYRFNTGACGTSRYRKGVPRNLKLAQVKRKRDKFIINNATQLAMKFKDRTVFQMLSSVHSVNEVEIGCTDHGLPISKPEIVHDYNMFMEAVDWCDRVVAYSCFRRRTMKSWKEVIFHLFSLTILNA